MNGHLKLLIVFLYFCHQEWNKRQEQYETTVLKGRRGGPKLFRVENLHIMDEAQLMEAV